MDKYCGKCTDKNVGSHVRRERKREREKQRYIHQWPREAGVVQAHPPPLLPRPQLQHPLEEHNTQRLALVLSTSTSHLSLS